MEVKLADSQTDFQSIAIVMQQLRTQFPVSYIKKQMIEQMESGYKIAYVEKDGKVLCIAGFVIGQKLSWGKHIYVDDLVTNEQIRSESAGSAMIKWLKGHAKENECQQIHLDAGVQRYMAHKFYLREGFIIASHHFSISPL